MPGGRVTTKHRHTKANKLLREKLHAAHGLGRIMAVLSLAIGPKSDRGTACPHELRGDEPAASAPDVILNGALQPAGEHTVAGPKREAPYELFVAALNQAPQSFQGHPLAPRSA